MIVLQVYTLKVLFACAAGQVGWGRWLVTRFAAGWVGAPISCALVGPLLMIPGVNLVAAGAIAGVVGGCACGVATKAAQNMTTDYITLPFNPQVGCMVWR